MISFDLLTRISNILDKASGKASEYSGLISSVKGYILEHFGNNGLYAAYIVLIILAIIIISRLVKITFAALKYLVIPAVTLAFLGTFFLPYSFITMLPITATFCSLFLLFKT
ncbi:MAG: hypothetical protein PHU88_05520 [candidate division Zixibacteria bacterium]|nr:hypothetical protein [candidate division Zixibacteria bacterium]MDD5427222.1 hypothetical protein [candidate division Zixibacteria bacterium]